MLARSMEEINAMLQEKESLSFCDILRAIGRDSHLIAIIILSILNIVLSPLPVNSFILGVPLMLISVLYMINLPPDSFGTNMLKRQRDCTGWRKYMGKAAFYAEKVDRISKPRMNQLFILENRLLSGISLLLMALVIFLPIPFANIPGSIGMICVALGLLQRDGLLMLIGYIFALLHLLALAYVKYELLAGV